MFIFNTIKKKLTLLSFLSFLAYATIMHHQTIQNKIRQLKNETKINVATIAKKLHDMTIELSQNVSLYKAYKPTMSSV